MISNHLFPQLPSPATVLPVLSILSSLVAGHVLPRETKTVQVRSLNIMTWPLATPAPISPQELLRRQSNTICGYIGGDPQLPATCLAGSHCAVDVNLGAIGCCPDKGPCNVGIYTGCVDGNSGPQSVADPYVFTCSGKNVCYKNTFEGGYFQYGCGSNSGLATTVVQTATGKKPLELTTVSISLTAQATTLSLAKTSDSTTSSGSSTSDQSPNPSETSGAGAAPSSNGSNSKNTGAIIGGAIGGAALLFALAALAFFLWRRKSGNNRGVAGGEKDSKYQRQMTPTHPENEPLTNSHNTPEHQQLANRGGSLQRNSDGVSAESGPMSLPQTAYSQEPFDLADGRGQYHNYDSDRVPLTRELDDFSQGFNTALGGIDTDSDGEANQHNMATYPGPRRNGSSVLWQQNRRRSRNLAWI